MEINRLIEFAKGKETTHFDANLDYINKRVAQGSATRKKQVTDFDKLKNVL